MHAPNALTRMTDQPALDRVAAPLSRAVRHGFERGGRAGQLVKEALKGGWLGHPLHPVFVDTPIGAWTTALVLDGAAKGDPGMRRAATLALGVGLLGALGAAITGIAEWSETQGRARRTGLMHGVLNVAATSFIAASLFRRSSDPHATGRTCAWSGYVIALASAYLGGDLVYAQGVGVMQADEGTGAAS
jgi:uncharacterized membrane protein